MTIEEIGRAISSHDFEAAYPYLADDVTWAQIGEGEVVGRDAVIGVFEQSATYLSQVTTDLRRLTSRVGSDWVVVESLAAYTDNTGSVSVIASCDVYDFRAGRLTAMASYNIELPDRA